MCLRVLFIVFHCLWMLVEFFGNRISPIFIPQTGQRLLMMLHFAVGLSLFLTSSDAFFMCFIPF